MDSHSGSRYRPKEKKGARTTAKFHTEYFWSCCNCKEHGPMSRMIDSCPGCSALRCTSCPVESAKIRNYDGGVGGYPEALTPSVNEASLKFPREASTSVKIKPVASTNESTTKLPDKQKWDGEEQNLVKFGAISPASRSPSLHRQGNFKQRQPSTSSEFIDQVALSEEYALSASPGQESSITLHDFTEEEKPTDNQSDTAHVPLSPEFTASASLSGESKSFSDVFTEEEGSTDSQTDIESDNDYSSDEDTTATPEDELKDKIMKILDSCILAACSHNLAIAALLIRQMHASVHSWTYPSNATTADGSEGNSTYRDRKNEFSSGPPRSNEKGSSNGLSEKRPRGSGGDTTSDRPERRQRISISVESPGNSGSPPPPTFACHFCKRDPQKYNFRANRKYKNCPTPSVPANDLRRIKTHFESIHRVSQCERCWDIFESMEILIQHRQLTDACEKRSSELKEGIDDGQWQKIVHIIKKTKHNRGRQDFDKWYDIWKVLFSGTTPPPTPYNEPDIVPRNSSPDTAAIMNEVRARVEIRIEQETLPRDDRSMRLYEHLLSIFESALDTPSITSASQVPTTAGTEPEQSRDSNADRGMNANYERPITGVNEATEIIGDRNRAASPTQHAHNDMLDSPLDGIGGIISANEISNTPTNAPPQEFTFHASPLWNDSRDISYLLRDPLPPTSNSRLVASHNPSIDPSALSIRHGDERETADDTMGDNFYMDAFLAWDLASPHIFQGQRDDTGNTGNTGNTDSGELPVTEQAEFNDEVTTDLGTMLESEVQQSSPLEPFESRRDRNKALKGRCDYWLWN